MHTIVYIKTEERPYILFGFTDLTHIPRVGERIHFENSYDEGVEGTVVDVNYVVRDSNPKSPYIKEQARRHVMLTIDEERRWTGRDIQEASGN